MNLKSLRFRLLAGGAVAVAVALVAAWFFLTLLFEHHLERRLADELQRDGVRLVSGLTAGPGDSLAVAEGPRAVRSDEHTSELESLMRISYTVFCLKKTQKPRPIAQS